MCQFSDQEESKLIVKSQIITIILFRADMWHQLQVCAYENWCYCNLIS